MSGTATYLATDQRRCARDQCDTQVSDGMPDYLNFEEALVCSPSRFDSHGRIQKPKLFRSRMRPLDNCRKAIPALGSKLSFALWK